MNENINFVYGYGYRRGQKCPTITVAIDPQQDDDEGLFFTIGVAICSEEDFPSRSQGRKIAVARINGLKVVDNNLRAKPYRRGDPAGRIIALRTHWEDAPMHIAELGFSDSLTERVTRCCATLARKFMPEIGTLHLHG